MSGGTRCSARPSELIEYARETDDVVWQLRSELHDFDVTVETSLLVSGGISRMTSHVDPLWESVYELESMASWVSHIGWSFAVAGADGDARTSAIVAADAGAVDYWSGQADWKPAEHLRAGAPGEWLRALNPECSGYQEAGYLGSGFIVGRDGRSYPLVAPFVRRGGVEYHADDGLDPGELSVLELDGRDADWTTIDEQLGVERWRHEPNAFERVMSALGSSAGFRPVGSTEADVNTVVLMPGMAPTFRNERDRPPNEPSLPPYMREASPQFAPRNRDGTKYPDGNPKAGMFSGVPIAIDALAGAAADNGSYDAYDIVFQQNADGRIRALYKRVYVGFDQSGNAGAVSTWVTGPERNDRVIINYAR